MNDITHIHTHREDVQNHQSAKLCVEEAIQENFIGLHRDFPIEKLNIQSNVAAIATEMNNNRCDAAIMKEDAFELMQAEIHLSGDDDDDVISNCDKTLTKELVLTLGNAYPVRPEVGGI